jgi:energy-coupling factor transporter ATP-binding protein EcfA2
VRISRLQLKNFRNFRDLDLSLGDHVVIVGENGVGKSNLLHALRLVLDPALPDTHRTLREEDFWDGVPRPLPEDAELRISIELADFEENDAQLASLAEFLISAEPMVARLTYVARPTTKDRIRSRGFDFHISAAIEKRTRCRTTFVGGFPSTTSTPCVTSSLTSRTGVALPCDRCSSAPGLLSSGKQRTH